MRKQKAMWLFWAFIGAQVLIGFAIFQFVTWAQSTDADGITFLEIAISFKSMFTASGLLLLLGLYGLYAWSNRIAKKRDET